MDTLTRLTFVLVLMAGPLVGMGVGTVHAQSSEPSEGPAALQQFDTNLSKHSIDLSELKSGGPSKDGIPSIDDPTFVPPDDAQEWIDDKEPVIALEHDGHARAYPLQILTFHEIVNDRIGGTPVAVTFCPLCYSAIIFKRTIDGDPVEFGVSGLLRNSDLVMYDRKTESLWQQFTGKAIVGTRTGTTLERLPAQILSFRQFVQAHPDGEVLSRETGYRRPYGRNPYAGYDDVDKTPFAFDGPVDGRLPPMSKVVAVSMGDTHKAYPYERTKDERAVNDVVGGTPLTVFHSPGAASALDAAQIADSKETGSTGAFRRRVKDRTLTFTYAGDGRFEDEQTGSTWTVTGRAVSGPLQGTELEPLEHGDYFAFAWFAFRPETALYGRGDSS